MTDTANSETDADPPEYDFLLHARNSQDLWMGSGGGVPSGFQVRLLTSSGRSSWTGAGRTGRVSAGR